MAQNARKPESAPRRPATGSAAPVGMAALAAFVLLIAVLGSRGILSAPAAPTAASATDTVPPSANGTEIASPTASATPEVTRTTSPSPSATAAVASSIAVTPWPGDETKAISTVRAYQEDLVHGRLTNAWNLLAPEAKVFYHTYSEFAAERTAFMKTTTTSYTLGPPTHDWATSDPSLPRFYQGDFGRAFLVRVDWNAVPFTNADWDLLLVMPNLQGEWEVASVR